MTIVFALALGMALYFKYNALQNMSETKDRRIIDKGLSVFLSMQEKYRQSINASERYDSQRKEELIALSYEVEKQVQELARNSQTAAEFQQGLRKLEQENMEKFNAREGNKK